MNISVFEGKRKENEAVKCEEKERCPVEFIEALARVLDQSMMQAAKEKGITIDVYTDMIHRIGGYTEKEEYDVAFDMLLQLASVLETDAKFIIEGLPFLDENAVDIFLEYFAEYIEDGHVLDLLLEIPEDEEEEWEEVSLEDVLDEAYRAIKEMFCGEVKVNEGSEDNRHM